MRKRVFFLIVALIFPGITYGLRAQEGGEGVAPETVFRVEVEMVLLNVAVTDSRENYVTGLHPSDFSIYEDGIEQELATFGEGNAVPRRLPDLKPAKSQPRLVQPSSVRKRNKPTGGSLVTMFPEGTSEQTDPLVAGASVFILFDTSNYMYEGFVYAQDAIAEFVRALDSPDQVALYTYSRDLHRISLLTPDRWEVLRGLRKTVAGSSAALYNALLLTLKDAATLSGRKVVVVFSNGPDNASMVAPENVRELAQAEGVSIYMISTREAKHDPVSSAVFQRISESTGGKSYFAKSWSDQQKAFASVRDDLAHLYTLSYYPQSNPNSGWRSIEVKLIGNALKRYQVRTRSGYRPRSSGLAD
jgi:Ca-activated chloride channel homolog